MTIPPIPLSVSALTYAGLTVDPQKYAFVDWKTNNGAVFLNGVPIGGGIFALDTIELQAIATVTVASTAEQTLTTIPNGIIGKVKLVYLNGAVAGTYTYRIKRGSNTVLTTVVTGIAATTTIEAYVLPGDTITCQTSSGSSTARSVTIMGGYATTHPVMPWPAGSLWMKGGDVLSFSSLTTSTVLGTATLYA
jgi:hypothetical protein